MIQELYDACKDQPLVVFGGKRCRITELIFYFDGGSSIEFIRLRETERPHKEWITRDADLIEFE